MKTDEKPKTVGKLGMLPHKVVDLIDYQADAVVSREILKAKTGTVTVFAFDAGQGLSEHTAPFDALTHILDGEAEIAISGKTHQVRAGEIIIMPANKPHALKAVRRFKMMLVMIRS
jgi:quercetin dioxygenase-like cupin family protein